MRSFLCTNCDVQLVFFENSTCLHCAAPLGYLPTARRVVALAPAGGGRFEVVGTGDPGTYRRCANEAIAGCNWLVGDGEDELCRSCALTRTRPNDADGEGLVAFAKAEAAKRRLVFQLDTIGLPLRERSRHAPDGLAFDLLSSRSGPVTTGHADGIITLDLAESDDAVRERTRLQLGEPYRTLLGHVRHEIGHFYFGELVASDAALVTRCRALFGDERVDYAAAIERHYRDGPPAGWAANYVSGYATMHPFEDWAETFAHFLHIHDTLETADNAGLRTVGPRDASSGERTRELAATPAVDVVAEPSFGAVVERWLPLTYALNAVNRSMGRDDLYPFVLPAAVIEKLAFVHEVVRGASVGRGVGPAAGAAA